MKSGLMPSHTTTTMCSALPCDAAWLVFAARKETAQIRLVKTDDNFIGVTNCSKLRSLARKIPCSQIDELDARCQASSVGKTVARRDRITRRPVDRSTDDAPLPETASDTRVHSHRVARRDCCYYNLGRPALARSWQGKGESKVDPMPQQSAPIGPRAFDL